jgi:hypothetical protein
VGKALGGLPEENALSSEAGAPGTSSPDSIGRYLERQRRLRGISLDELAALTRIPARSLERLEAGAFDRQPDGFTRGFVRTVAGAIGLDPDVTVERMLTEVKPQRIGAPQNVMPALIALLVLTLLAGIAVATASWLRGPAASVGREPAAELRRRDFVRELADRRVIVAPRVEGPGSPAQPHEE